MSDWSIDSYFYFTDHSTWHRRWSPGRERGSGMPGRGWPGSACLAGEISGTWIHVTLLHFNVLTVSGWWWLASHADIDIRELNPSCLTVVGGNLTRKTMTVTCNLMEILHCISDAAGLAVYFDVCLTWDSGRDQLYSEWVQAPQYSTVQYSTGPSLQGLYRESWPTQPATSLYQLSPNDYWLLDTLGWIE